MSSPTSGLTPSQLIYADADQWMRTLRQFGADLRCAAPAFLTEDMDADQTVTAQIAVQEFASLTVGAAPQWVDVPPIFKVPVKWMRGGGFSITHPLKKGDEGFLLFADMCIDYWWQFGQTNAPRAANLPADQLPSGTQTQMERRRHDVTDCVFLPGVWSQPNKLTSFSTSSLQIRSDDGTTVIDLADGVVTITTGTEVDVVSPAVNVKASGGTPLALVNDTFFQWWKLNIFPFLQSKGYAGPGVPTGSETTVLKGQ